MAFPTSRLSHYLLLIGMGLALFFCNLGGASLWDVDEGRNATCAREMLERGTLIVPTFNSQLRVDKPALLYWLQMLAYQVFGANEFSARLPSAVAALLTVLVAYELGRGMFGASTGFWAGALAASTPMLCGAARFANPDALLNAFTVMTLAWFWLGQAGPRWLWFVGMGLGAGLAVMAKGPVGLALPGGVIFLFLLWERRLHELWDKRLLLGLVALLLVAAPWYVWVAVNTKADFLRGFIMKHNVNRFLSPMESHGGFPGFYLLVLLVGTLPWSIFFVPTAWSSFWSLWRRPAVRWQGVWEQTADRGDSGPGHASAYRFLVVWVLLYLVFFSLAATKLPNYVLPVVVPFLLLSGRFLERWRLGLATVPRAWMQLVLMSLVMTGLGIALGVMVVSGTVTLPRPRTPLFPDLAPWAALGSVPVIAAGLGWWLLREQRRTQWLVALLLCAVGLWSPLAAWASAALNPYKAAHPLVVANLADESEEMLIGGYQVEHLASLHFYVNRSIHHHLMEADALQFLRYPVKVCLFVPSKVWDSWKDRLPPNCRMLGVYPDIYRKDSVVLVTNRG